MSSPKRSAEKPGTTSSDRTASGGASGLCEGVSASVAPIGDEIRRASLNKQRQRPDAAGRCVNADGDLGATAAPPSQPWSWPPGMDSLQHSSGSLGCAMGRAGRSFPSLMLDSVWGGSVFDSSYFPRPMAVRRPSLVPAPLPLRLPTAASTSDHDQCASLGRQYLTIWKSVHVYLTDDWREMSMCLYIPLSNDIMINTHTVEQISYESNYFFLGDSTGKFAGTSNGYAVNFWQHDPATRKLYIALSFVFLRQQDYNHVMELLKQL